MLCVLVHNHHAQLAGFSTQSQVVFRQLLRRKNGLNHSDINGISFEIDTDFLLGSTFIPS